MHQDEFLEETTAGDFYNADNQIDIDYLVTFILAGGDKQLLSRLVTSGKFTQEDAVKMKQSVEKILQSDTQNMNAICLLQQADEFLKQTENSKETLPPAHAEIKKTNSKTSITNQSVTQNMLLTMPKEKERIVQVKSVEKYSVPKSASSVTIAIMASTDPLITKLDVYQMEREEAESLLTKPGHFLLRESTASEENLSYTLSVCVGKSENQLPLHQHALINCSNSETMEQDLNQKLLFEMGFRGVLEQNLLTPVTSASADIVAQVEIDSNSIVKEEYQDAYLRLEKKLSNLLKILLKMIFKRERKIDIQRIFSQEGVKSLVPESIIIHEQQHEQLREITGFSTNSSEYKTYIKIINQIFSGQGSGIYNDVPESIIIHEKLREITGFFSTNEKSISTNSNGYKAYSQIINRIFPDPGSQICNDEFKGQLSFEKNLLLTLLQNEVLGKNIDLDRFWDDDNRVQELVPENTVPSVQATTNNGMPSDVMISNHDEMPPSINQEHGKEDGYGQVHGYGSGKDPFISTNPTTFAAPNIIDSSYNEPLTTTLTVYAMEKEAAEKLLITPGQILLRVSEASKNNQNGPQGNISICYAKNQSSEPLHVHLPIFYRNQGVDIKEVNEKIASSLPAVSILTTTLLTPITTDSVSTIGIAVIHSNSIVDQKYQDAYLRLTEKLTRLFKTLAKNIYKKDMDVGEIHFFGKSYLSKKGHGFIQSDLKVAYTTLIPNYLNCYMPMYMFDQPSQLKSQLNSVLGSNAPLICGSFASFGRSQLGELLIAEEQNKNTALDRFIRENEIMLEKKSGPAHSMAQCCQNSQHRSYPSMQIKTLINQQLCNLHCI